MRIFGKASEFYRVRVQKLVEEMQPSMKWDESISYRQPPPYKGKSRTLYLVQAIRNDDKKTFQLKKFTKKDEAERFRQKIGEILELLTKNQFEEKFPSVFD